jgi:hypothetical protein
MSQKKLGKTIAPCRLFEQPRYENHFATFAEGASKAVASVGVAVLISGVLVLIFPAFRRRAPKSPLAS